MRFTWRTVSDVLSDKELKSTLGGYGNGYNPADFPECCYCRFLFIFEDGSTYENEGWFCGNEGEPNCVAAVNRWCESQGGNFDDIVECRTACKG